MESMREVNRVMEREIAKGSTPLLFEQIRFGDYSYNEITSKEKLLQVLSYLLRTGEFQQYGGKRISSNVYMDVKGKKTVFKIARFAHERNNILVAIKRLIKKYKPDYEGKVYLETVRCFFSLDETIIKKYRYMDGYAFPMSEKYIMGLYTQCLSARKEVALEKMEPEGISQTGLTMVKLEGVREVLFQTLLFDNMKLEDGKLYAELCSIYLLE